MKKTLRVLLAVMILLSLLGSTAVADETRAYCKIDQSFTEKGLSLVSWLYGPSSVNATVNGTKIKLSWGADSSYLQTGYVVTLLKRTTSYPTNRPLGYAIVSSDCYYIPQKVLKKVSGTSCTITMNKSGTYYLSVSSYYSSPSKYLSSNCRVVKVKVSTALKKPTGVKATLNGSKVKLTWKTAANAKSYAIYRATGSGSFKKIGTTKKLKYTDSKVKAGNTYKYKIQAINGSKKKYSSVVKITIPGASTPSSVTYRALLLANTYPSGEKPLPMCEDDRYAMENMLKNLGATSYTVYSQKNSTGAGMKSAIQSVFSMADDDDVTILYYTGHGADSRGSEFYPEYQGALCGVDSGLDSYVTASELRSILDQYKGTKVILLNSCFSGSMIGKGGKVSMKTAVRKINSSFIKAFYSANSKSNLADPGYYVLTACSGIQEGTGLTLTNGAQFSIFTLSLVDGLGWNMLDKVRYSSLNADSNSDNKVSFAECYSYTRSLVDELENYFNTNSGTEIDMDVQVYPVNSSAVFFAR